MKTTIDVSFAYVGNGFSVEDITCELDILPTTSWDRDDKICYEDILRKDISTRKK